jgi:ubiquinone/menaquinone biosynthesis C-methylase UbiE
VSGPSQATGHRSTKDVVREALRPAGRRILDIGSGAGALVAWLRREGGLAIGIEPNVPLLQAAFARSSADRGAGPNDRWIAARAEKLPLADGSVDATLFFNSLHHVDPAAQGAALAEAARVLRPGGDLLVIEPLASGSYFELLRPLDDETAVRAAALAAIDAIPDGLLVATLRLQYMTFLDYADVAATVAAFTRADPARAAAVEQALPAIAERFARLGRPGADGSRRFEQPMLAVSLRRLCA